MLNHVLDLHKTNKRFKDAYDVAISIGYLREAVRLARSHGLSVSQPELIIAFNYVQAEDFLSSITLACNTQKSKVARKRTRKSNNEVFLPLERKWKALIASFDDHRQGGKPNRNNLQVGGLGGFFDLVVREIYLYDYSYITNEKTGNFEDSGHGGYISRFGQPPTRFYCRSIKYSGNNRFHKNNTAFGSVVSWDLRNSCSAR